MIETTIRAAREGLVRHHIALELAGDATGVVATFKHPRYDLVALGAVLEGAEQVAQRVRDMAAAMPGCEMEIESWWHADDAVIIATRTTGVHSAPLLGIAPSGRRYETRGIAIFHFNGTDLVGETVYYDRLTLIDQLNGTAPAN